MSPRNPAQSCARSLRNIAISIRMPSSPCPAPSAIVCSKVAMIRSMLLICQNAIRTTCQHFKQVLLTFWGNHLSCLITHNLGFVPKARNLTILQQIRCRFVIRVYNSRSIQLEPIEKHMKALLLNLHTHFS